MHHRFLPQTALLLFLTATTLLIFPSTGSCWFGRTPKTTGPMPQFSLDLPDGSGVINSDDFRGKVVLVNFWATWCGPCVAEFPELQKLHNDLQDRGFTVLGLSADKREKDVVAFIKKNNYTFPIAMTTVSNTHAFGAGVGLPVSFLVDRKGMIVKKYYGPRPYETFRHDIEKVL